MTPSPEPAPPTAWRPRPTPAARAVPAPEVSALWTTLSVLFAAQSVGLLGIAWRQSTSVGVTLFMDVELAEQAAVVIDRGGAASTLLAAILLVARVGPAATVAAGATAWMALVTVLDVVQGGHFGAWLAPVAHAVRWGTPLLLVALARGARPALAASSLRWMAAAVFLGHGIECLMGHPTFTDFLIAVPDRWLGWTIDQATASGILRVIGGVDVVVAGWMAFRGDPPVAAWMTFWGFLTAAVRVLYFGVLGWPDAVVRVANGGAPAVVLWLTARARQNER